MGLLTPLTDRYAVAGLTDVTVRIRPGGSFAHLFG